jgi:DNA-binding transcriptional LysR family regulator
MDLKELETFVTVAEHLHFGAAARHLGLAQPQVSRRIRSLETALDAQLFDRGNRAVKLTPFGKLFLPEAISLLKKAAETRQTAVEFARGRNGVLAVSMIDAATLNAAPAVFKTFHQRHPDVHIAFRHLGTTSSAQLLALADNSADLVFTHPPDRVPEIFGQVRLVNDPLVAVLPRDHPLAERDALDLAELRDDPWIMFPRTNDPPVHDRMTGLCKSSGFTPRIVFETGHMLTRLGLVASGYGVHMVHRAWQLMPYPGVVYIPVTPTMNIVVSCFWRLDNDSDLLKKILAVAEEYRV